MNHNQFSYTPTRGEFNYKGVLWNEYTRLDQLQKIEAFQFLPSDIVINTFPRSGTTLSQEIIWQIKNRDMLEPGVKYGNIDKRFPFLEFNCKFYEPNSEFAIDTLERQKRESAPFRMIKTHCPLGFIRDRLVQGRPKVVVVFRNPRDVCVSMFHFYRGLDLFGPWTGDWEEFEEIFERGFTKCGPWLRWHEEWWEEIGQGRMVTPNPFTVTSKSGLEILFYSFETLIKQPREVVTAIADFMGDSLTPEQTDMILGNTNFSTMASDKSLNFTDTTTGFRFLRKGQIGNWRDSFSEQQLHSFQASVEGALLERGMNFEFE